MLRGQAKGVILKGVLRPDQKARGFFIQEDEHFVYIWKGSKCHRVFSSSGATMSSLRREVDEIIQKTGRRSKYAQS